MDIKGLGMPDLLHVKMENKAKVLAREVLPELKDMEVRVDISREGMEALRKKVQEMPGTIDMEEWMKAREVLPKLQMDLVGTHYFRMAEYEGELLEKMKEEKEDKYTVEDIRDIQTRVYDRYYKELQKTWDNHERDIYISNGIVDGKAQYHQVSEEEDFEYLKQAYERLQKKVEIFQSLKQSGIKKYNNISILS